MEDVILFLMFAAFTVGCAVNLVLQRHPISSALSLVGVMGALGLIYLQLGGEFISMAQLIVYAGAILVLFIFVIMLLNAGIERKSGRKLWGKYAGAPLLVVLIGLIAYFVQDVLPRGPGVNFGTFQHGNAYEIGMKLFQIYLLPFEVTSILILVAIIGAIVLARKEVR